MAADNEDLHDEFTVLVTACHDRLFGYVYANVHNMADTEDLVQRTVMSLWSRFDTFERGTNFAAWALTTARHEVLNFRRRAKRQKLFDEDIVARLAETAVATRLPQSDADRREALRACVDELHDDDRRLLDARYQENQLLANVASSLSRSEQSVSRSLGRIRRQLFDCIRRKLAQEAHG